MCDVTDARLLAKHIVWAANSVSAQNEAFNVVNGDVFRWSWLWPRLARWFGVNVGWEGTRVPAETEMAGMAEVWSRIAKKYKLVESEFDRIAMPWFIDLDLGRIQHGSMALRPKSPKDSVAPRQALPFMRPRCVLRYLTRLGCNIGLGFP